MDTIGTSVFELKVYTTTSVAEGDAGIITNTTTLDGRKVDKNGYTEDALSEGKGLVHSDEIPNGKGESYKTPYSKQCFILSKEDNAEFFQTLKDWDVKDNELIRGIVFDTERMDK